MSIYNFFLHILIINICNTSVVKSNYAGYGQYIIKNQFSICAKSHCALLKRQAKQSLSLLYKVEDLENGSNKDVFIKVDSVLRFDRFFTWGNKIIRNKIIKWKEKWVKWSVRGMRIECTGVYPMQQFIVGVATTVRNRHPVFFCNFWVKTL